MRDKANWLEFLTVVDDILGSDSVKAMSQIPHHLSISCFEHSLFVSYLAYRAARALGLDCEAAARAGLLHDLYLYDKETKKSLPRRHCFSHPGAALKNASEITELSEKEQNIILSHMWPVPGKMPRSREAVIVNLVDKYCAVVEAMGIWYKLRMRMLVRAAGYA